ncbi:MAG: hypothetical protein EBR30_01760 [Cytophagia bacterium]|nr:hypothetical protein [Cytophagia bacterium]
MARISKAQGGKNVPKGMVESEMFPGKMIPKTKSNYATGKIAKMAEAPKAAAKPAVKKVAAVAVKKKMKGGGKQMLKRADGSVSQRGLWDNIRAAAKRNKAAGKAGKKPTAAMLKQERKIKAKGK